LGSLKKELLALLVSLAADLFDFEVAPWSTSLFGRFGDNSRAQLAAADRLGAVSGVFPFCYYLLRHPLSP
jgi:hypothetical protein